MVLSREFAGPVLSFSEPANSHLELTGLCLGNAREKGWCSGAWEPSPSSGHTLWEISSAWGILPKISRHCSVKVRGTGFVSSNTSPAELEHPDAAPSA